MWCSVGFFDGIRRIRTGPVTVGVWGSDDVIMRWWIVCSCTAGTEEE